MASSRILVPAIAAAVLGARAGQGQAGAADPLHARVAAELARREAQLIEFRRDLHRHPEVSGAEERTARLLADRLRQLGLEVRTGVGGHGIIAVIRGAMPGPMVAFRADMDAVPSDAPDPVEFRSLTPGVRHICGHDVHATIGLALAEGLAAVRDALAGSVMLIFQPAEERATGARAMLADGLFTAEKPAAIFALHTAPLLVGHLGTAAGGLMGGRDDVRVTFTGSGDLKAAGDSAQRLIQSVGTIGPAEALQPAPDSAILVRSRPPREAGAGEWLLVASISTASAASRARARETILRGLASLGFAQVTVKPVYDEKTIAGVTNDPDLVRRANRSIAAVMGDTTVSLIGTAPLAFSEDFGSFQERVPGVMFFLGVSNPARGWIGMPHSPGYVADEASILVGARAMTAVLLDRLAGR